MIAPPCACMLCASAASTGNDGPSVLAAAVLSNPISGDYRIDSLIYGLEYRWNAGQAPGTPVEVTYSFMTSKPTYGGTDSGTDTGFEQFTAEQKTAVKAIFSQLASLLNITFREVVDTAISYGQIRFGNNIQQSSSGYAFLPFSDPSDISGDVWINRDYATALEPGSFNYATLVHEIGHALGLKHPGNYNAGETSAGDAEGNFLGEAEDNLNYTAMSYNDASTSQGQQRVDFGLYDMLALSYFYGARNVNTEESNTYSLGDGAGLSLMLIQDSAGSQDTLDLSGVTLGSMIDMGEGKFSSIGKAPAGTLATSNVSIMYGSVIEHLVATTGSDTITGNASDNRITGNGGSDMIDGGAGNDTVVFAGNRGNWSVTNGGTQVSVRPSDSSAASTLTSIERLQFTDMAVNLTMAANAKTVSSAQLQLLEELYVAYFNRIPDADGLNYWVNQLKAGQSITQIGESFYAAAVHHASLTGYSATMTNAEFVRVIYKNVLGRDGATVPPDDVNYWANRLKEGTDTRGSLVEQMLGSAHTFKGDATWGWVADLLDNKVTVANYFAVDNGLNYNTAEDSIQKGMNIAALITATDTSEAIKLIGVFA